MTFAAVGPPPGSGRRTVGGPLIWGSLDPLGGEDVARSIAAMIERPTRGARNRPRAWLGRTEKVSRLLSEFARADGQALPSLSF